MIEIKEFLTVNFRRPLLSGKISIFQKRLSVSRSSLHLTLLNAGCKVSLGQGYLPIIELLLSSLFTGYDLS